jgi:hypothetical protein
MLDSMPNYPITSARTACANRTAVMSYSRDSKARVYECGFLSGTLCVM